MFTTNNAPMSRQVKVVDLHGYHPSDICGETLTNIIQQAYEMGYEAICFIHGHGRTRGISPGFVNTNTGHFGVQIRRQLRGHDEKLRQLIKRTTLECSDRGSTRVKLKQNPAPTRAAFDDNVLPKSSVSRRGHC